MAVTDTIIDLLRAIFNTSDNSISVKPISSLITSNYDYVAVTYPLTTQEVYTFKSGGSSGTTIATITVVYTDTTKASISSVTKV